MPRVLELKKPYRYFDRKSHRVEIIQPGTYKVPEEVASDIADQSYFVGVGRILIVPPEDEKPKKRAPKNKSLRSAPENKQALG